MSLDVWLEVDGEEVFEQNITHNLVPMAKAAGLYECLWRPDEQGWDTACSLVAPMREGLCVLVANRAHMETHDPENGWGEWINLVDFASRYLDACNEWPDAAVRVCR